MVRRAYGRPAGPFNKQSPGKSRGRGPGQELICKAGILKDAWRQEMSDFDPDSLSENEWEENGDLAWNEFDWEVYLREQESAIHRYLGFYESLKAGPERIDEVADRMGWDRSDSEEVEE